MSRKVAAAFAPGVELTHIYDFGTESVSLLRPLDARTGKRRPRRPVELMARNAAPVFPCQKCDSPATVICLECVHEHNTAGTLCDRHATEHRHRSYGPPTPLVNSPRTGMCGYEGPAEPPY